MGNSTEETSAVDQEGREWGRETEKGGENEREGGGREREEGKGAGIRGGVMGKKQTHT